MENSAVEQFPASVRVIQTIQARISEGYYSAGAWLPTERELANELAVSRPVVRDAIARLAEQGLVVRAPGCRPRVSVDRSLPATPPAARPRFVAQQTIAAVIPHQPSYFSAHAILRGINQTLFQKEVPFRLTIFDTYPFASEPNTWDEGAKLERSILERIEGEGVAGVIIWHLAGDETLPNIVQLQEKGTPVVFIDRYPANLDCDYVGVDNRTGVKEAVDYLLDLGHRRIAYVTKPEQITTIKERLDGYREAFLLRGLMPSPELIVNSVKSLKTTSWKPAIEHLSALADPPTAAVVVNDFQAFALITEAQAHGWRIPEDLSVIGFDDIECYSPHPAMLTTVRQPFYQIGQRAADLLLRRLDTRASPSVKSFLHTTLSTTLVKRSTCRALG